MAAIIGQANIMQAAQNSFISSTSWTERIGPTAALATIRKFKRCEVAKHLGSIGQQVQEGWRVAAADAGLPLSVSGMAPLAHFSFDYPNDLELRTLFTQLMLEHGFLAKNAFYATYSHQDFHIKSYLDAVAETFALLSQAVEQNLVSTHLKGPVAHAGFHRLA
ncbi:MAG: aminotransferase class III, partial [bacterium]|nr:aminotransferase class III [bacterium]